MREKTAAETPQECVTRLMKANKSAGTKPELALRLALWQAGAQGYCLHPKDLPGRPDIAFPGAKVAVFVHGCYWHQCLPLREQEGLSACESRNFGGINSRKTRRGMKERAPV